MHAENTASQLKLTAALANARQTQLSALETGLLNLQCEGSSLDCRTYAAVSGFLTYLASRMTTALKNELENTVKEMRRLKDLPDQAQWDYRCAHSLGVAEGLNRIGTVQAKIIEQSQAALHKAAILLMAGGGKSDLPATSNAKQDFIESIIFELNPRQGKRLGRVNQQALTLSMAFLKKAMKAKQAADMTISAICATATDVVVADICASLSNYASEAVQHGVFLDDPASGDKSQVFHMARLIAAGIISVLVIDLIQENAPWVTFNLN